MRTIDFSVKFRRDVKREKRSDPGIQAVLEPVLDLLVRDDLLPERLKDHALVGKWRGFRDCHVKPDLVLIYRKQANVLELVRLGSHSELFG